MSGTPRRRLTLAATALACVAAASGCSSMRPVAAQHKLDLALTEYRLDPQSVRVHPGRLTIVVRNDGRRTHNLVVTRAGELVGSTHPLWPGQSSQFTVTLLAGNYLMASTILNDQLLGEYGKLVVR